MKNIISNIIALLLIVAAVMALAYYLPWVAIGTILFLQVFHFLITAKNNEKA